jgi:Flp pilus assembly protein TadG
MLSRCGPRSGERGQGVAEFALILPLLLALVFGIYDFGRGMSANVTTTNAAREGARYLAAEARLVPSPYGQACPGGTVSAPTAPSIASAQGVAWRQLQTASLDLTQVTMTTYWYSAALNNDPGLDTPGNRSRQDVKYTCAAGGSPTAVFNTPTYVPAAGDSVVFEIAYVYRPSTPVIAQLFSTITITRDTTMVLE